MFDVPADDVAGLTDAQLRELVGRLCEAEMRRRGLSPSAVTWGGDQDAPDGGLDVRVALPSATGIEGFVPCAATGFQVKKSDMPAAAIREEMRPRGAVRPVIAELARVGGAYVIVSSGRSLTDSALGNRLSAMRDAVGNVTGGQSLHLDFYDSNRLATWARDHPGVAAWVREVVGRKLAGWQPHGAWAHASEGGSAEYLFDEQMRISTKTKDSFQPGMSALEAIRQIRGLLSQPRYLVRLVGLSGVGKTRLVQVLFDDRIGEQALDPTLALYTDVADGPDPAPLHLASNLIAAGYRMVLVIDNCSASLHRSLGERCRKADSQLSVITVEHDIQDDQPEGTEFFKLEPSSPELIERLLALRFPTLSSIDARTVADFSGGNARVAVALAGKVRRGETITGLSDRDLLVRLFQQSHQPDGQLMRAAQACSLVYSFDGEDVSNQGELARLGVGIDKTARAMYRDVAELLRRDLAQQRGTWRAILPHAIANRLATTALEEVSREELVRQFEGGPERLLQSFSRRLGYLSASRGARAIVERWLTRDGLLHEVESLSGPRQAMLRNVAPVAPGATLLVLERAIERAGVGRASSHFRYLPELLRKLAYEADHFERCALLLAQLAEGEADRSQSEEAARCFTSLFQVVLSGTHATVEQRLKVIQTLIHSKHQASQQLGCKALATLLQGCHLTSHYDFDFGAQSRDFGYRPASRAEVRNWFQAGLIFAAKLSCSNGPNAAAGRMALSDHFRCLWSELGLYDELEEVCRIIRAIGFWREGWIAIKQTIYFDANKLAAEFLVRLKNIEILLRPRDLAQQVRTVVLGHRLHGFELSDSTYDEDQRQIKPSEYYGYADGMAETLGQEVAADPRLFEELLPEVVECGSGRLWHFGRGLCNGSEAPLVAWKFLIAQLITTLPNLPGYQVACGFLHKLDERDHKLAQLILDEAAAEPISSTLLPILQSAIKLNTRAIERLLKSLRNKTCPASFYKSINIRRTDQALSEKAVRSFLQELASIPDGLVVAIDLLWLRLDSDRRDGRVVDGELMQAGRDLLQRWRFTTEDPYHAFTLGKLAKDCLAGRQGYRGAQELAERLGLALAAHQVSAHEYCELVEALIAVQPIALLNGLFGREDSDWEIIAGRIHGVSDHRADPFAALPTTKLLRWCSKEPAVRYPIAASIIQPFSRTQQGGPLRWTALSLRLIDESPDRREVLAQFMRRISPNQWSNSLVEILTATAPLLDDLMNYPDESIKVFLADEKSRLAERLDREREWEAKRARERDQSFE